MHRLQGLNLAFNKLSGPIPAVLGNLVSLVKMDLTGNLLTGAIPKTLGKLKACSASDLCELPGLTFLNVSEDNLALWFYSKSRKMHIDPSLQHRFLET